VLAAAWPAVRRAAPEARLIIAPHEPVERHLRPIEEWAAQAGLTCARLSHPRAPQADVVLVDRVGVLGDLYALGSAAFVGGGFHAAGLHSVLEPAAFAIPVACGPLDASQRDAALLQGAGGLERVADTAAFGTVVGEWLRDRRRRTAAGHAAREVVVRGLGAADRATEMVLKLLS
jgi:3-deoxy-D-manno-octulosonic-acid transferase